MKYVTGTREYLSVTRCGRQRTNIPARVFPDVTRHPARAICRVMRTSERYPSRNVYLVVQTRATPVTSVSSPPPPPFSAPPRVFRETRSGFPVSPPSRLGR